MMEGSHYPIILGGRRNITDSQPPGRQHESIRDFTCTQCQTSFKRKEHLERHLTRHQHTRPFTCSHCCKSFRRRDSLKRHIAIHSREESGDLSELRQPKRAAQACVGCVRSKQRCVGSTPCNRCNRRGIGCVYPTSTNDSEHMKSRLPILHEEEIILPTTSSTGIIASQDSSSDIVTGTANVTENIGFQISHINNGALGTKSSCTNPNTENSGISTQGLGFDMNQSLPYYDQTYVSADDFMSGLFPHLFSLPTGWGDTTGDLPTSFYEGQSSSSYFVERNASHTIHDTCRSLTPLQTPLQTPISTGNNERNHILLTPDEQSPLVVFPNVQSNDLSSIAADRFGHSAPISDGAYSKIRHIYTNQRQGASALLDDTAFPPVEVLNSFVELFFEHFNHTVPIVHQATFKPTAEEWILLLGILAVGSQYSSLPSREQFGETFQSLLQRVISRKIDNGLSIHARLSFLQAILLLQYYHLFSGTKQGVLNLQYQRNLLITLLRPFISHHGSIFSHSKSTPDSGEAKWLDWVGRESWIRLTYFTWYLECLQQILLDLPPILTPGDLRQSLPSGESLWECSDTNQWETLMFRQKERPSLAALFRSNTFQESIVSSLTDTGRLIVLVSLYVEERRSLELSSSWLYAEMFDEDDSLARWPRPGARWWSVSRQGASVDHFLTRCEAESQWESDHLRLITQRICHLLSILRRLPLRLLYVYSGWMATTEERSASKKKLSKWVNQNRESREALLHATALFQSIRSQMNPTPLDPWCLLIASLYIWTYITLAKHDSATSTFPQQVVRLDRHLGHATMGKWLEAAQTMDAHIMGIGMLGDADSATRTLQEAINVLRRDGPWGHMGHQISQTLDQILRGLTPSIPD